MIVEVERLPPLQTLPRGTILGYFHYRLPNGDILIPSCYIKEWEGRRDTEIRFTREWLKTLPRIRRSRAEVEGAMAATPPLFAKIGGCEALYIDITAAYPSIWQRVGWKAEYFRGRYFSLAKPTPYPLPMEWRIGRAMPVAGSKLGWVKYWTGKAVKARKFINKLFNPSLRWATLDILQSIASFAVVQFGAMYFNVDGAIIPVSTAAGYVAFLSSLGLGWKIKGEGHAYVAGVHSIVIGNRTIGAGMSAPKPFSNLSFSLREAGFLLEAFQKRSFKCPK